MEKPGLILVFMLIANLMLGQSAPREFEYQEGDTTYTMKEYVLCIYSKGENRTQSKAEADELQRAHLSHIASLKSNGLIMAGPFGDDGQKRGVLLFDLPSAAEASELVDQDPMVIAGRLDFECNTIWLAKGTLID
jgi:uncharacterized protein YciI